MLHKTFEKRVRHLQPDVVVIYEATNDLSGDTRDLARAAGVISGRPAGKLNIDADAAARGFEARLEELVRAVQRTVPTVALVVFAPRLRRERPAAERINAAVTSAYYMPHLTIESILDGFEAYNRAIRRVAERNGALLIETGDAIPPDATHYADSVHFTDAGSAALAQRVGAPLVRHLKPALQARRN